MQRNKPWGLIAILCVGVSAFSMESYANTPADSAVDASLQSVFAGMVESKPLVAPIEPKAQAPVAVSDPFQSVFAAALEKNTISNVQAQPAPEMPTAPQVPVNEADIVSIEEVALPQKSNAKALPAQDIVEPKKPLLDIEAKESIVSIAPKPTPQYAEAKPTPTSMPISTPSEKSLPKVDVPHTSFFGAPGETVPLNIEGATAAPADVGEPIGMVEAVAYAIKNNFEVQASTAGLDSAKWDKYTAYAMYLPSVEYSAARGTERSKPGSYNDDDGNRVMDTKHFRTDRQLTVRQPLLDPALIAGILKQHSNQDMIGAQDQDIKEGIAFDTIIAFLQLLQAKKSMELYDQYKAYLKKLHKRMEVRVQGGAAIRADLDRVHSRLMLAEAQRLENLGLYTTKLGEFRRLTRVTPALLKVPDAFVPGTPTSMREAMRVALKNNPSYLASQHKIEVARGDRNSSFSNLLPKLSLEYSRVNTYNAGGSADGNPVDGVYPKQDDERLMLVAKWSLTGGMHVTSGMSGDAKVRQMMMLSRDVRARVESTIETGYDALDAARRRISILEDTYKTDFRIAEDFEMQYKQGNRSLFELLDSYERLHNSKLALMRTIIAKAEVAYQIKRQMGSLTQSLLDDMGI